MRNRKMFRSEGRGMGQRCGMGRRFAMNSEEIEGVSVPREQGMGQKRRAQGFGRGRGQGEQRQGLGRGNRCR